MKGLRLLVVALAPLLVLTTWGQTAKPIEPVSQLDIVRYMGRWHEIARLPNRFQRDCQADTTADYALLADRRIRVVNRCRRADGHIEQAIGEARRVGAPEGATLQVRFAPAWLSWIPWVWGDYWVIDIDDEYQISVVSEPRREYLWILARAPAIEASRYASLVERLAARGFDVSRLQRTDSSVGER